MKKQSRLIMLLLVGTLGLTPFSGLAMGRVEPESEGIFGDISKTKIGVSIAVIVAGWIVAHFASKEIKKRLVNREVRNLRTQLPGYSQEALELAATVKLYGGLEKFTRAMVRENVVRLKNPKRALRLLAQDEQQVNAIAVAVQKTPEQVKQAFENPGIARAILSPF